MGRRLEGQTAWISGAASGIGEATARLFADEGANVAVVDLRADRCEAVCEAILSAGGARDLCPRGRLGRGERPRLDRRDRRAIRRRRTSSRTRRAWSTSRPLLHEYTEAEWDQLMDVNVKSIFFAVKHAIPHLRRGQPAELRRQRRLDQQLRPARHRHPRTRHQKAAVLGLSRSIAARITPGIGLRCNCICPGITDTPMLREHLNKTADPDATLARRLRRVPTGEALAPEQVARAILDISCEDSAGDHRDFARRRRRLPHGNAEWDSSR